MGKRPLILWARPTGIPLILIWSGAIVDIPPRFHLCNGANLTPDLRNRFVRGVQFGGDLGTAGGVETATRSHDHAFPDDEFSAFRSDDEDAHDHTFGGSTEVYPIGVGLGTGASFPAGGQHAHGVTGATTVTHAHKHIEVGVTTTSGPETLDLRPPWYALAYIKGPVSLPVGGIALSDLHAADLMRFPGAPLTTLAASLATGTSGVLGNLNVATPATAPLRVYLDDEQLFVFDTGDDGMTWTAVRGYEGTPASAHAAGTAIVYPQYAVCDGSNGTPDLSEAFAIGAGGIYVAEMIYGTNGTILENDHDHGQGSVGATTTSHTHDIGYTGAPQTTGLPVPDVGETMSFVPGGTTPPLGHVHRFTITSDASFHAHDITDRPGTPGASYDDPTGVSLGGRWYKLYYLQRLTA